MKKASYDEYFGMMADSGRIEAFRQAIQQKVKKGDVVVDLGAGLGLLSFLCIQSGASKVFAIEERSSIELAHQIAKNNGWQDRIIFIRENSKNVELPERVDGIVSETLGSFGIDENTVDFVNDARDRFLKDDGYIIPEELSCWLSASNDEKFLDRLSVWKQIEGIDFSSATEELLSNTFIQPVSESNLISTPVLFERINFYRNSRSVFAKNLRFQFAQNAKFTGFVGWFDCKLCEDVNLTNSPHAQPTHWKQVFYPLEQAMDVFKGEMIDTDFAIQPSNQTSDESSISFRFSSVKQRENNKLGDLEST